MDFSEALKLIKEHKRLTRKSWNGKGQYVSLTVESHSQNFPDFMYIYTVQKTCVPWVASQTDILAEDWELVE